jgi:predicted Na+-dependent transporter
MALGSAFLDLAQVAGLLFVIASMLAMGLALTIPTIVVAVSNVRLMTLALVANFVVVPALAYGAAQLISTSDQGLRTGLILVGAAAGAPFLPKLVQTAREGIALGVGLMVVLMVVTIAYLPLVLPRLLPGSVSVDSWQIAKSLIFLMLLPLAAGLLIRARWASIASTLQPIASRLSTYAIAFLMVALLVVNFRQIVDTFGTRGIGAALILLVGAFGIGFVCGGPVVALGTAQRNLSAAIVVAAQNFGGQPQVITMVMVVGVLGLILLFAAAGELGRRELRKTPELTRDADEAKRIAEEAYVFAYPMLEFYKSMFGLSLVKRLPTYEGPLNRLVNKTELLDANFAAVVSPNNDTLYTILMCDLRAEPLVLTVPPVPRERYFSFALIDQYTHLPAFIGTRMGDNDGGTYMIAGPSWDGETEPSGVTRVLRIETDFVFCLGRTQVDGPDDLPAATALMQGYTVQPLSAGTRYTTRKVDPLRLSDIPIYDPKKAASVEFVGYLNWLLGHVEPNAADADTLARFSKIGVAGGAPFFSDALPEEICDAIEAGVRAGDAEIDRKVTALGTTVNGWQIVADAFGDRSRMQNRWLVRAAAARFGLFGNPEEEAAYPFTFLDADADELDGAHNDYVLHLPVPAVGAFWSVTMYRVPEKLFAANPLNRYSIGDRTPGLTTDGDGTVAILLQKDSPGADLKSHWLPAPDGPFDLILRLYIPGQSVLDGSWRPAAVEKAGRVTAPTDERVLASAAT